MDEHRIGLQPITRPVWTPTGHPATRPVEPRYEWLYLYAFVCPESGASQFWLVPEVTKRAYQLVVAAFAASLGAGPDHHIVLVEDGAGFHVPPLEGHPPGLETVTLPPYSPELQPVERAWNLTDEPLANRCFESLAELQEALGERCAWLETQPDLITQHTLFHWWPLCTN
ncbi:IS630 family transposase [Deinococcus radiopugnans]|uniref:IS630 family transposase n=2 Tax=Deinococcus radiopugnans ATCC 19172 TaxID=585398 RepID=A0A5C4XLA3_9DEIO|nr:IS630 family transposase [Deinococcus radiopugnans ATCC 19172]